MEIIADLQLHSRFSRAVSKQMTLSYIAQWAQRKGIGLVATGDWTHPMWMREIESQLEENGKGLLKLKSQITNPNDQANPKSEITPREDSGRDNSIQQEPLFLLATEVSCIYSQGGKVRRIHTLIWVPTLDSAHKISKEMTKRGCNLLADGRPIIGLTSIQIAELVLTIEPKALITPAHAWTPWFSVYGALGGFDSIDEAFGPFAKNIYAVETGLSSSPAMNWRIAELDNRSILSFSDAHSGPKLGREATVFEIEDVKKKDGKTVRQELSYDAIYQAIIRSSAVVANENFDDFSVTIPSTSLGASEKKLVHPEHVEGQSGAVQNFVRSSQMRPRIAYTIEFHPEEGKYHYTGHRACNIRQTPEETKKKGTTCPVCGKTLTIGVMHRVEDLALRLRQPAGLHGKSGRSEEELSLEIFQMEGMQANFIRSKTFPLRPPFVMMVPLQEIIAEAIGSPVLSPKVQTPYFRLIDALGDEFTVLLKSSVSAITKVAGERVAAGIDKVRKGEIVIDPGYDGVFGVVKIWREGEEKPLVDASKEQLSIFG